MTKQRLIQRVGLIVLAPLLSLCVVFSTPTTAHALNVGDITVKSLPKTINPMAGKVPPVATVARVVGFSNPASLTVTTAGLLGMAAWETRDTWVPWVTTGAGKAWDWITGLAGGSNGPCRVQRYAMSVSADFSRLVIRTVPEPGSNCDDFNAGITWRETRWHGGNISHADYGTIITRTGTGWTDGTYTLDKIISVTATWPDGVTRTINTGFNPPQARAKPGAPLGDLSSITTTKTDVECYDPTNGQVETLTGTNKTSGRIAIPSCQEHLPGTRPKEVTVTEHYGDNDATGTHVGTWTDPQVETYGNEYPDCFTPSGALQCKVAVWIAGLECTSERPLCYDWQRTMVRHPDVKVECRFGTYVVDMANCTMLKHAYAGPSYPLTTTTTDGTPTPNPDPNPDPVAPGTGTGTGTIPQEGTNPGTTPGTDPAADPDSANCWGTGWSWNPISWVYVPIKCALKWAFVPAAGAMTGVITDIKAAFDQSTPGLWLSALDNLAVDAGLTGCQGPTWNIPAPVNQTIKPFNACSGAAASAASVVKLVATVGIVLGGAFACVRAIGAGFGWNPTIRQGGTET